MVVAVLAAMLIVGAARLGGDVVERVDAQTAADATALAGLSRGRPVATSIAHEHDAVIERWELRRSDLGDTLTVTVRIGSHTATAVASSELEP